MRIYLSSSTPLILGGYDCKLRREINGSAIIEPLRTQSIKGLLRWWFRAYAAGAFYRMGFSSNDIERKVRELSNKFLGSTKEASHFVVNTNWDDVITYDPSSLIIKKLRDHSVARLIYLRGGADLAKYYGYVDEYFIELKERIGATVTSLERKIISMTFITSLLLGCLGRASRKGLGCFDIITHKAKTVLEPYLWSYIRGLPKSIGNLIADTSREFLRVTPSYREVQRNDLPPIPAIAPNVFDIYYCEFDGDPLDLVLAFDKALTRRGRTLILGSDPLRKKYLGWILGLPRSQRGRGYIVRGGISRRPSPFMLSVHRSFAFLSVFFSSDWPSEVEWRGIGGATIKFSIKDGKVNGSPLKDIISFVCETIIEVLKKQGFYFKRVSITW